MGHSVLEPDFIIIGAGVVGVPLAIALRRKGHSVLLCERSAKPLPVFKGEYLQPAAAGYLRALGLHQVFAAPSVDFVRELRFRDLGKSGEVVADLLMRYPDGEAALSISHHELIEALHAHARQELGDGFLTGVSVEPLNETAPDFHAKPEFVVKRGGVDTVTVRPKWVVGCDGRSSTVRRWIGGPVQPKNAPVVFSAGEEMIVGMELPTRAPNPQRYEVIRTFGAGTISLFSLGQHGQRVYHSVPTASAGQGRGGMLDGLRLAEMQTRPYINIGPIEADNKVSGFPAYTQFFCARARGRFLLAGDAASVTTPYGGQGMSAGLENVRFLAEEFDWQADNRRDLERQKDAYARAVQDTYDRINLLNFGLFYLFFSRNSGFKPVSAYIADYWMQNADIRERVMRLFGGLDTDTPDAAEILELWGVSKRTRFASGLRSIAGAAISADLGRAGMAWAAQGVKKRVSVAFR